MIKPKVRKHHTGYYICEIVDTKSPHLSIVAWGKDENLAIKNAVKSRIKILSKLIKADPEQKGQR